MCSEYKILFCGKMTKMEKGKEKSCKKAMQLVWNLLQHFVVGPTSLKFLTQPFLLIPLAEELK